MPGGSTSQRDVTELPGAVAVVALDEQRRVVLVRQYRHPVGRRLWEVPAGLLDNATESAQEAGERELAEEAGLRAGRWDTLVDMLTTPGMSDETVRVLLARELRPISMNERAPGVDEEAELEVMRVSLDDAVDRAYAGDLENGITVCALLAADAALRRRHVLRPADAAWRARKPS